MSTSTTVLQLIGIACVIVLLVNAVRFTMRDQYHSGILQDNLGPSLGFATLDVDAVASLLGAVALGSYLALNNDSVRAATQKGLSIGN
jgi:hypothetical protein